MTPTHVIALDQGATRSWAVLFNRGFEPGVGRNRRKALSPGWKNAVRRTMHWGGAE